MGIVILVVQSPIRVRLLGLHGLQHARPLCPSPSPYVCPNFCYWWCHPAISFSDALFSFCPQSFPGSGTFPMSQLFAADDQHTGVPASASVLPKSTQCWFPLRLTGLISLLSRTLRTPGLSGTLRSLLQHCSSKASIFGILPSLWSNSHNHMWPLGRRSLDYTDLCQKSKVSAFQHTVQVCHSFSTKTQSSSDSMAAGTVRSDVGAQEEGICLCFHHFPFYLPCRNGADAMILVFSTI